MITRLLSRMKRAASGALIALALTGCASTPLLNMSAALGKIDDSEAQLMAELLAYSKGEYGTDSVPGFIQFREDMLHSGAGPADLATLAEGDPGIMARWDLLMRGGGASDADIASAKALAGKLANTPQFFTRKIEEAGAKDGAQTGWILDVLTVFAAVAGQAANNANNGSAKSTKSNPRTESHASAHVAAQPSVSHTSSSHTSVAHPSVSHASSGSHGSSAPHAEHESHATGASHHAQVPEHASEPHHAAEGEHAGASDHPHEAHVHHKSELKTRIEQRRLKVGVEERSTPRYATTEVLILGPGMASPVAIHTGLGTDETAACDDATMQAIEANECVADPEDLDMSECNCTNVRGARASSATLCSIRSTTECRVSGVAVATVVVPSAPPSSAAPPPAYASLFVPSSVPPPVPPPPPPPAPPPTPVAAAVTTDLTLRLPLAMPASAMSDPACKADSTCKFQLDRCAKGDVASCKMLGFAYQNAAWGVAKDSVRAAAVYQATCDADPKLGCMELAMQYSDGTGVTLDKARGMTLMKRSCEAKEAASCSIVATWGDKAFAIPHLRALCDANNWMGCTYVSSEPGEKLHALSQLRAMCAGGDQTACSVVDKL